MVCIASGPSPSSARMRLTATWKSGAVSSMVPSRSMMAALILVSMGSFGELPGQFAAHGVDDGLVVGLAEDGGTGHEGVGAGFGGGCDVVDFDAAVDFQHDVAAGVVDPAAHRGNLLQCLGNERLAAEARIDGHDQDDVDLVHDVVKEMQRRA